MEQKSMRHGAKTILRGCSEIVIAAGQHINKFVTTMPWIAVFIVSFVSVSVCAAYMMKARAERNTAETELYDIQKKYDSLRICIGDNN